MLGGVQNATRRPNWRATGSSGGRFSRHILKLERDYSNAAGEVSDRIQILIRRLYFEVCDLTGGRVLIGREGVYAVPHAPRRNGEHASELPAAKNADGAAGQNRFHTAQSLLSSRTASVCCFR